MVGVVRPSRLLLNYAILPTTSHSERSLSRLLRFVQVDLAVTSTGASLGSTRDARKETFTKDRHTSVVSFKKPFRATPVKLGEHYQAQHRRERRSKRLANGRFTLFAAALSVAMFSFVWSLPNHSLSTAPRNQTRHVADTIYYSGCNEARSAGAAPIHRGQPGYRLEMDGDGDGIACEPHRTW